MFQLVIISSKYDQALAKCIEPRLTKVNKRHTSSKIQILWPAWVEYILMPFVVYKLIHWSDKRCALFFFFPLFLQKITVRLFVISISLRLYMSTTKVICENKITNSLLFNGEMEGKVRARVVFLNTTLEGPNFTLPRHRQPKS